MKRLFKAESIVGLLMFITLFSLTYLIYSAWQSQQNQQAHFIYQRQQALQIAENQMALKMAKIACKRSVSQNSLQFKIDCGDNHVTIHFPLGKVEITKP